MGMAAQEAEKNYSAWRKMMIEEKGHSQFCAVLAPGGKCDCTKPNLKNGTTT